MYTSVIIYIQIPQKITLTWNVPTAQGSQGSRPVNDEVPRTQSEYMVVMYTVVF